MSAVEFQVPATAGRLDTGSVEIHHIRRSPIRAAGTGFIVVFHRNTLDSECLARSLQVYNPRLTLTGVGCLDEVKTIARQDGIAAFVLVIGHRSAVDQEMRTELRELVSLFAGIPIVLVADAAGPADILTALEDGAKGYVSTSSSVEVLARAIALAATGGTFVPASCIFDMRSVVRSSDNNGSATYAFLTKRQTAVANAVRQGKANKLIAYELNMCESTVKVHVRTIMKKLGASNRTQVAYKLAGWRHEGRL